MKDKNIDWIGNLKLLQLRAKEYAMWLQLLIVGYTGIYLTNLNLTHLLILAPAFLLLIIIDWKIIYPSFQDANARKNPFFKKIMKRLDNIEKQIEEKQ